MNLVKDFVMPTVVLTVICAVISASLVYTQGLTAPIIEKAKAEAEQKAISRVLPTGDTFSKLTLEGISPDVTSVYKAQNNAGFVVSSSSKGYGGPIVIMTGINSDGTISKVEVLSNSETPGLGTKVTESAFTSQFDGKNSTSGIEKISGASISSGAFVDAVNKALDAYNVANGGTAEKGLTENIMTKNYPVGTKFTMLDMNYPAYKCGDSGYVVSGHGDGYYDQIHVAVLFDANDVIIDVVVTEINDTADLGKMVESDNFRGQFKGKKDTSGIETIVGATTSSEGFIEAVKMAIERLPEVKGAK